MFDQAIFQMRAPADALRDATVEINKVLPTKKTRFHRA